MICKATKKDGSPCKGEAKDNGYCVAHYSLGSAAGQAKLRGVRRARNLRVGHKGVTMVRPICREGCTDGAEVAFDWYLSCPHDPYVGKRERREQVPVYSEPNEDGSVTLERMEERVSWEVWPNFVDIIQETVANSGQGVEKARAKGFIFPEQLRSPAYPNGVAPMCQYRGCQWQEGLKQYRWGVFCRVDEARLVGARQVDEAGNQLYGALPVSGGRRRAHLESIPI